MSMDQLLIYGYVIVTIVIVVLFYSYIVHLYRSEKKGEKDYEKYGKMALDDEIDSQPVESLSSHDKK